MICLADSKLEMHRSLEYIHSTTCISA